MRVLVFSCDRWILSFKFCNRQTQCGVYDRAKPPLSGSTFSVYAIPSLPPGASYVALWLHFFFRWCVGVPCFVSVRCGAFCDVVISHAQIKKTASVATGGKNKRVMYVKWYDTLSYYTMPCVINLFQLWTSVLYKTHDKLFFVLRFISASVARFPIS